MSVKEILNNGIVQSQYLDIIVPKTFSFSIEKASFEAGTTTFEIETSKIKYPFDYKQRFFNVDVISREAWSEYIDECNFKINLNYNNVDYVIFDTFDYVDEINMSELKFISYKGIFNLENKNVPQIDKDDEFSLKLIYTYSTQLNKSDPVSSLLFCTLSPTNITSFFL